uniref:hypothetical protein n=1 Tax=Amycolatopsis sp. CA-096443 TaxID=3239919 RepID=UPI003F499F12
MPADELDLDSWKSRLERVIGNAVNARGFSITDLAQTDAAFTATLSLTLNATAVEGLYRALTHSGTAVTGTSESGLAGGKTEVTATLEHTRNR